jgi:hypothetical protein
VGIIIGSLIGLILAVFGFAAMRDPMRLNLNPFSPNTKGYYQRMVLDTTMRIQLRVLGVLICLFGSGIFAASVGSALKLSWLTAISEGLWVLMGLIFFAAWGVGLIILVRQLFKGELFDWWRMWKVSAELGPVDVFPPVTAKMQREVNLFTIGLVSLALVSAIAALFHQLT